jgi:hypothetical protein
MMNEEMKANECCNQHHHRNSGNSDHWHHISHSICRAICQGLPDRDTEFKLPTCRGDTFAHGGPDPKGQATACHSAQDIFDIAPSLISGFTGNRGL